MKTTILLGILLFCLTTFGQIEHQLILPDSNNPTTRLIGDLRAQGFAIDSINFGLISGNNRMEPSEVYLMDSTIGYRFDPPYDSLSRMRTLYIYDEENRKYSYELMFRSPSDTIWAYYTKVIYTFDDENYIVQAVYYQGHNQDWTLRFKDEYEYDDNHRGTITISSNWDAGTNQYVFSTKYESTYDENGNRITHLLCTFDTAINDWKNLWNEEYTYDIEHRLIMDVGYWWNNDGQFWSGADSTVYQYTNGNESKYYYVSDSTGWRPSLKYITTWDNTQKRSIDSYKYIGNSEWLFNKTEETTYNELGNIILQESYKLSEFDSLWKGDIKKEYIYNEQNQLLATNQYSWSQSTGLWVDHVNSINVYDEYGVKFYTCFFVWDNALSLWYKDSSQLFYYSSTSSIGDSELPHLFVQVFPNPCRNQISIDFESNENECADYQIFSVTGKLVDAGSVEKANPISVEKLNSGLYLIQAQSGSRIYMGKFIKN
jgi:hypothetical protein